MSSSIHPQPAFHFQVEAGFTRIGFTRVQLPRLERELIRYREGADRVDTERLLPGLLKIGECVLERGVVAADNAFFAWLNIASFERRDVIVRLLDESLQPVLAWRLRNAFPVGLEWSMLDARTSAVLIETLRLAVEGLEVEAA